MKTARAHRKFAIYSGFLDTILEGEEEILDGETRKDTLKRILKDLEETAAELKKEAEAMKGEIIRETVHGYAPIGPSMPDRVPIAEIPRNKLPEDQRIAQMISDIYSCPDIKTLEAYRLLAKTKPEFQAAYDTQLAKLNLPKPQVND